MASFCFVILVAQWFSLHLLNVFSGVLISIIGFLIHFKIPEFMMDIIENYLSDISYNLIGIPKVCIFLISVQELWLCVELFSLEE